jgi:hypothetical protein
MSADSSALLIVASGTLFLPTGAVPEVVRADGALEIYEVGSMRELFPAPYMSGLREIVGPKKSLYPLASRAQSLARELLDGGAKCG